MRQRCAHRFCSAFHLLMIGVLSVLLAAATAGCGGEDDPGGPPEFEHQNSDNDNQHQNQNNDAPDANIGDPDANTGDPDANANNDDPDANANNDDPDANANNDDPDANDNDGEEDYPKEVDSDCGPIIDLGPIDFGDEETIELDFDYFDNDLSVGCADGDGGDIAAVEFTPPMGETGQLDIATDEPAAIELREGFCDDMEEAVTLECLHDRVEEPARLGVDHHILIEPDEDVDELELSLEFEEMPLCVDDDGAMTCVDDQTVEICNIFLASPDDPREYEFDCPTQCTGDRCEGDDCDAPITVEAHESFEWTGQFRGFMPRHDVADEIDEAVDDDADPSCVTEEWSEDDTIYGTAGRDMIFEVQHLADGDELTVHIDYPYLDRLAVMVKSDCSTSAQCHQYAEGQQEFSAEIEADSGEDDGDITRYLIVSNDDADADGLIDLSIEVD